MPFNCDAYMCDLNNLTVNKDRVLYGCQDQIQISIGFPTDAFKIVGKGAMRPKELNKAHIRYK